MKSPHKMFRILALAALVGAGAIGTAQAATISVSPSTQTVVLGAPASVDIVVSLGLNEALGAFDFGLVFSDLILNGASFTIDPGNAFPETGIGFEGGAFGPLGVSPFVASGSADITCDFACLKALQGAQITLATLSFNSVGLGLSPLTLIADPDLALGDDLGLPLQFQVANGSVCVTAAGTAAPCAGVVPEPASLTLLGVGLAAAFVRRRATRRAA